MYVSINAPLACSVDVWLINPHQTTTLQPQGASFDIYILDIYILDTYTLDIYTQVTTHTGMHVGQQY